MDLTNLLIMGINLLKLISQKIRHFFFGAVARETAKEQVQIVMEVIQELMTGENIIIIELLGYFKILSYDLRYIMNHQLYEIFIIKDFLHYLLAFSFLFFCLYSSIYYLISGLGISYSILRGALLKGS